MGPNKQRFWRSVLSLALLSTAVTTSLADEPTAADLLPPSTVIFAEIARPQELLSIVYDHKLAGRIEALDQVQAAMEKKGYLDFKAGVAAVESQMGLPWRKIVGQATGGGIAVALDAKTQGVVILARATDDATQSKLVDTLVRLASADAKNKGGPDPFKAGDYRGLKTYAVEKGTLISAAGWLVASNKEELAKQVVDRLLDKPKESLAAAAQFAKACAAADAKATVWGYVNTAAVRDAGLAKQLFSGQAENPPAELLFGGVLSTLKQTPYVTVALDVSNQQLRLSASAPHDRGWAGESREYFFGSQGKGVAPPRLVVDDAIASLCAYRDVSAMWARAGSLLNEESNEALAKADSGLSTLFSGKDFGEDILGSFQPAGQIVVARQVFAEGQPAPAIKLPAFALVVDLKDPATMQPELRRTFQSLIGFFNVVGAMNGQAQLEMDMEKTEAAQFVTATPLADPKAKDPKALKINYNFSPSIAFAGSRFVVASTKTLAHTLAATTAKEPPPSDGDRVVNTSGALNFAALREILTDNRGQLVAQNMLKEGHTKEEAEMAIGLALELVGWLDDAGLSLETTPSELRASLEVRLKAMD